MLAVGIVARVIHFRVAALFAKILKRLAAHAQVIFHLCNARAAGVPLLLELTLADFEAKFFTAEAFELLREFFALLGERGGFITNRGFLLLKRGFAPIEFRTLILEARGKSFGSGKAFIQGGEFGACCGEFVLFGLNRATKLCEVFNKSCAFCFRIGAADRRGGVLILCALGTHSCFFAVFPKA